MEMCNILRISLSFFEIPNPQVSKGHVDSSRAEPVGISDRLNFPQVHLLKKDILDMLADICLVRPSSL